MKRISRIALTAAALVSALLAGAAPVAAEDDLADLVVSDRCLTIFEDSLAQNGLLSELEIAGPLVVVAPTDHAFDALSDELPDDLDLAALVVLLTEQVSAGFTLSDIVWLSQTISLYAASESIVIDGNTLLINDTYRIVAAERQASNGVLYTVDVEKLARAPLPSRDYPLPLGTKRLASLGADPTPHIVASWPAQPDYAEEYWARAFGSQFKARVASRDYPLPIGTKRLASLGADPTPHIVAIWSAQPDYAEEYWARANVERPAPVYGDSFWLVAAPTSPVAPSRDSLILASLTHRVSEAFRDSLVY